MSAFIAISKLLVLTCNVYYIKSGLMATIPMATILMATIPMATVLISE